MDESMTRHRSTGFQGHSGASPSCQRAAICLLTDKFRVQESIPALDIHISISPIIVLVLNAPDFIFNCKTCHQRQNMQRVTCQFALLYMQVAEGTLLLIFLNIVSLAYTPAEDALVSPQL